MSKSPEKPDKETVKEAIFSLHGIGVNMTEERGIWESQVTLEYLETTWATRGRHTYPDIKVDHVYQMTSGQFASWASRALYTEDDFWNLDEEQRSHVTFLVEKRLELRPKNEFS